MSSTFTINHRTIAVTSTTEFVIQTGKNDSKYKTEQIYVGNLVEAVREYVDTPTKNGIKKRLLVDGKVLARDL